MVPDFYLTVWSVLAILFFSLILGWLVRSALNGAFKKGPFYGDKALAEGKKPYFVGLARCVIIESPYKGNVAANEAYGNRCLVDSLSRGEAPFASHLLYTRKGVLDDSIPEEREAGILAGLSIGYRMDATVVYTDRGVTDGMKKGIKRARLEGRRVEHRSIGNGAW